MSLDFIANKINLTAGVICMPASFVTQRATSRQKIAMLAMATLLLISTGVALRWATMPLVKIPSFLPFFAGIVIVTELLTAYLLAAQFRIIRRLSFLFLSAAYLYSGLIVVPYIMTFPGVLSPTGWPSAGPQSAAWLWVLWHGGFPLFLLAYASTEQWCSGKKLPVDQSLLFSCAVPVLVAFFVLGMTLLATKGAERLPDLVTSGNFSALTESPIGKSVIALNVVAFFAILLVTKARNLGHLGLAMAALASSLDVTLTLMAKSRFSLGWYFARVNSLVSAASVLMIFLYEIVWLYHQVAEFGDRMQQIAHIDPLTNLANRRRFDQVLAIEGARAMRGGRSICVIMVDVDFFKRFNDLYGHQEGDRCLCSIAHAIAGCLRRPGDLAARYGGEEFAVILPNTDEDGAARVANMMAAAVRSLLIPHKHGGASEVVTISIGLAGKKSITTESQVQQLVQAADAALYKAKETGRDRVCVSPLGPV